MAFCPFSQSDHDIIFATRKKAKAKRSKCRILARKYKKLDNAACESDVEAHDWSHVVNATDVNVAWDTFVLDFNCILDRHAPWKWMFFEDNIPQWATREFLSYCKQRDALEKSLKYLEL